MKKRYAWIWCLLMLAWMGISPIAASAQASLSFSAPRKALDVGEQVDFSALLQNGTATKWQSSDNGIAKVDAQGMVTGMKMGTAVITAKDAANQSAVCTVTVGYYTGVDLSYANGAVNWDVLKQQGINFVMFRSSYGWYDPVADKNQPYDFQVDAQLAHNATEAKRVGMPFGLYHYSYATSVTEAHLEASYMLNALSREAGLVPEDVRLPVVLDVEDPSIMPALERMGKQAATEIVLTFCEDMKKAGYQPMLYTSKAHFTYYFDIAALDKAGVSLWMAWWPNTPDFTQTVSINGVNPAIWQYTDKGQIPGISTNVDMDILYMSAFLLHDPTPDPTPDPGPDPDTEPYGKGDVDGDGYIKAADALKALQAATHKIVLSDEEWNAANVDGDEEVTANDALLILQYATKKVTAFPEKPVDPIPDAGDEGLGSGDGADDILE